MKKLIFLIFLIIYFLIPGLAQTNDDSEKLFPVFVKGKYGYINAKGEMIIKPQFDRAKKFHDGLALVKIKSENISIAEGRYDYIGGEDGYINRTGKFVIEPGKYSLAEDFSEGLARVYIKDSCRENCYGYIDTTGKVVIKAQFQAAGKFYEGTAEVRLENDKWGIIDKTGKFIILAEYDATLPFFDGIGIAITIKNKKSSPFQQKLSDYETFFFDKTGKIITRTTFAVFGWFEEGLVSIITEKGMGFIDKTGKIVIEPKFERVFGFSEGLSAARVNKQWGYIDKTGNFVIEHKYKQTFRFSEGLGRFIDEKGIGFIDKNGKIIIEPKNWDVSDFEDGLAFVRGENYSGYIDKTGKFVWKIKDE